MKNIPPFYDLIYELTYLVDNGAFIPKKTIMNVIDNGYDVVQYIDNVLNYKMNWSFLTKDNRDVFMEILVMYYENYSDKYTKVDKNGLLFLVDLCVNIIGSNYYENVDDDSQINCFYGNLSDKQISDLKNGQMVMNHEKYPDRG